MEAFVYTFYYTTSDTNKHLKLKLTTYDFLY